MKSNNEMKDKDIIEENKRQVITKSSIMSERVTREKMKMREII
jgi:hypothetical protein